MNTELYLVRHGEPMLQNSLLGSTDSPLSDIGWMQLESAFSYLKEGNFDALISSPLARCASFAQHFSAEHGKSLLINDAWKECHFGDWDGRTYQSLHEQFPQEVSAFFSDPMSNPPPNGERLESFCQRVESALEHLLENYAGKKLVVLTHAGVIRTLVAWCLKMDYAAGLQFRRFAVDYASITKISIYKEGKLYPQLLGLNHRVKEKVCNE